MRYGILVETGVLLTGLLVLLLLPTAPIAIHSVTTPLVEAITSSKALSNGPGSYPPPGRTIFGVENLLYGFNEWSFQPQQQTSGWFLLRLFHEGKYVIGIINEIDWNHPPIQRS